MDSQARECVTQEYTQLGFEGRRSKIDVYRFDFSREVEFSGIPSGCVYQGVSVPGVSASLQPCCLYITQSFLRTKGDPGGGEVGHSAESDPERLGAG